ncbi:MAG: histidine triad nucleotide-binding protein [Patescibacteria group bacterium]|jgi:histidine triad (HIT) family protein
MDDKCIFCAVANGESPADLVLETENVAAFYDINPKAPTHILIVPKKHIKSVNELIEEDKLIMGELILIAKKIAEDKGLVEEGYRIVINTGPHSGQVVDHIHLHLLGGKKLGPIC